ncbi:MAG: hypothetical protein WC683_10335, partial [bacterium]
EAWLENRSWLRIEREILAWAVRHYGSIRAAARALQLPRSTLAGRASKLEIRASGLARGADIPHIGHNPNQE